MTESEKHRPRDTDFETAKWHMEQLYDKAMHLAHMDEAYNDMAKLLKKDIDLAQTAIEMRRMYKEWFGKFEEVAKQVPKLNRKEDREEAGRRLADILEELSKFPPDVQGKE